MLENILKVLTSLRLTVVCLAIALLLVFFGTIAQVSEGLYDAQNRWFRSVFIWWGPESAGWRIPAVGVLMTSGYLLVLYALRSTPVSYVAPARELGIVLGAFVGAVGLKEGYGVPRVAGASVIVAGVLMIAAA